MRRQRWPDKPKPWSKPRGELRYRLNGSYKPWLDAKPLSLNEDVLLFFGTDILSLYIHQRGKLVDITDPQMLNIANTDGHIYCGIKESIAEMGEQLEYLSDHEKLGLIHHGQADEIRELRHAIRTTELPEDKDVQRARNLVRYQAEAIAPAQRALNFADQPWYAETLHRIERLFDGATPRRDDFPGALRHLKVNRRQLGAVAGPYSVAARLRDVPVRVHDLDCKVVTLYQHLDGLLHSAGLGPVPGNLTFTKRSYIHRNGELLKAA